MLGKLGCVKGRLVDTFRMLVCVFVWLLEFIRLKRDASQTRFYSDFLAYFAQSY